MLLTKNELLHAIKNKDKERIQQFLDTPEAIKAFFNIRIQDKAIIEILAAHTADTEHCKSKQFKYKIYSINYKKKLLHYWSWDIR